MLDRFGISEKQEQILVAFPFIQNAIAGNSTTKSFLTDLRRFKGDLIIAGIKPETYERLRDYAAEICKGPAKPNKYGIDIVRINRIIADCDRSSTYFLIHVALSDEDRLQLEAVANLAEKLVQQSVGKNPKYIKLKEILGVLRQKGTNLGISKRVRKGSEDSDVVYHEEQGLNFITLPPQIYVAYRLEEIIERIREAGRIISRQKGTLTKYLADDLKKVLELFRHNNII